MWKKFLKYPKIMFVWGEMEVSLTWPSYTGRRKSFN